MNKGGRYVAALFVVAALGACASVDKRLGDEEWYQKSHAVAVKAVDATTSTAGKTYKRMQKYLTEKDLLKTFTDAGEQSETAVLNALHKSGIAKSAAATKKPSGSAISGAPAPKSHKNAAPAPLSTVPEQYAGALRWPVDAGIISSEYGARWGKMHKGIDIAADVGEPVYAIADGEVIYAGDGLTGYGNVVIVRHDRAMSSLYAHNSELKVKQGDQITQGALVALLGSTGHSTGPHVHFEIREGDAAVDPHTLLPKSKLADVVCGHGHCESLINAPKLSAQNRGGQ
jgi:murein DD-endopeptidase MepM/ murein hydrolase activator NlpD